MLTVLTQGVGKLIGCSNGLLRYCILLTKHLFLFANLSEPCMFQSKTGRNTVIRVVNKHLADDVLEVGRGMWDQFGNARSFGLGEVKLHVSCVLLEFLK